MAADATCYLFHQGGEQGRVPIGRPIANTRVYVLDEWLQPVPIGVPGELYIGGEGLARGYLQRPDLTAARFIPDPFATQAGARLYRTGDLVRYLPDGNLEFLGRVDQQVKLRGFRIGLEEVEAALSRHPAVGAWAVVCSPDAVGDLRLVAYVVADRSQAEPSASELRRFLQDWLPDYMIPALYLLLPALPLTPSGKIDRPALPTPDVDSTRRLPLQLGYIRPETALERAIADIWQDMLHLERVGLQDNFFDIGGHSLAATRIIAHIQNEFGVKVDIRSMLSSPTIRDMAEAIGDSMLRSTDIPTLQRLLNLVEEQD